MIVGVPKEIKVKESRVGLVPSSVKELVVRGHEVIVETNAGQGIGASDADYEAAGAKIMPDASQFLTQAKMIVKVKEPQPSEWVQLKRRSHPVYIFTPCRRCSADKRSDGIRLYSDCL